MKFTVTLLFTLTVSALSAQVITDDRLTALIKKGADQIYNANPDSANVYIAILEEELPDHPVVPLMRAMTLLWEHILVISPEVFEELQSNLYLTVELAQKKDPKLKEPEMIFFAMAAHGLLAEYFADQGSYIRAIGEANRAYGLLKKGFDLVEDYPEFLFAAGMYNYFRVKYPEKHPIYRPLLWFFRGGDTTKGLSQLEEACYSSPLTKVEARIYLSYIYLRYEYEPEKAQDHLQLLCVSYPNNFYVKTKFLESMANPSDFKRVSPEMIGELEAHESPYYRLAGAIFEGYYQEHVLADIEEAELAYRQGLDIGEEIEGHGEYLKSLGYLGLGRISIGKGEEKEATQLLKQALDLAETDQVKSEAKELLSQL